MALQHLAVSLHGEAWRIRLLPACAQIAGVRILFLMKWDINGTVISSLLQHGLTSGLMKDLPHIRKQSGLNTHGGYTSYKNDINANATYYLNNNPGWPMYNPQWAITTPPTSTLFNTAITYYKGACVLHMLRYTLGDSLFFSFTKSYAMDSLSGFKHNSAATDDVTAKLSSVAGRI
jgi:hypothetical protein